MHIYIYTYIYIYVYCNACLVSYIDQVSSNAVVVMARHVMATEHHKMETDVWLFISLWWAVFIYCWSLFRVWNSAAVFKSLISLKGSDHHSSSKALHKQQCILLHSHLFWLIIWPPDKHSSLHAEKLPFMPYL